MMNPFQLIKMIKGGGNPQQLIQQMMGNNQAMQNPMMQNAMSMYKKNDTSGLQNMVENMCKERGITVDELRNQLGL